MGVPGTVLRLHYSTSNWTALAVPACTPAHHAQAEMYSWPYCFGSCRAPMRYVRAPRLLCPLLVLAQITTKSCRRPCESDADSCCYCVLFGCMAAWDSSQSTSVGRGSSLTSRSCESCRLDAERQLQLLLTCAVIHAVLRPCLPLHALCSSVCQCCACPLCALGHAACPHRSHIVAAQATALPLLLAMTTTASAACVWSPAPPAPAHLARMAQRLQCMQQAQALLSRRPPAGQWRQGTTTS